MASIGRELKTKGVIMTLLSLVLMNIGCEDNIGNPAVNPSEGKTVEVTLHIGFANEADGYTVATKSGTSTDKGAFNYELQPNAMTKGTASVKPDQLYNLEIQQYDQAGKRIGGMSSVVTQQAIGSAITLSLAETPDCQLVLVAWGDGNTTPRLGTSNTLEAVQKLSVDASVINNIPVDNMNKMPYILHLEHVKVSDGKLQSVEGEDVRLLLKRLAARLTISWNYNVTGYTLKQIILQSIPLNYKVVAAPSENNTYPSEMDQYTNTLLTSNQVGAGGKGSYSCWIPANVRGFNTASNSPLYRIKANAPTGSAYASFIAVNNQDGKKKLNYRVYLGGKDYSDFNLYENTDYSYTVNFNHDGIPTDDRRVTYIDPIPASINNENFVNTANCFMVAPGGYFNFNPYKYYVNGEVAENSLLQGWCKDSKIQSVKVLWQTLENGDIGDPVLGTVNSSDDHTNIVDLSDGNDFEAARIYCRVAPNTTGGSGVIAAYASTDGTGDALWSWHIWVTDYSPNPSGNETVLTPANKRKLKFTYNVPSGGQFPMMDRNLGAIAGYVNEIPATPLDKSKTNGFLYQWGRKDPFPSSYSNEDIDNIADISGNNPVKGMLNRYAADGITYFPNINGSVKTTTLRNAYAQPNIRYCTGTGDWCSDGNKRSLWGNNKTVNDPCPAGWKIISPNNIAAAIGENYTSPGSIGSLLWKRNIKNESTCKNDGGILVYYEALNSGNQVYIRFTGYPPQKNFRGIGTRADIYTCVPNVCFTAVFEDSGILYYNISEGWWLQDAHSLRCIQELK